MRESALGRLPSNPLAAYALVRGKAVEFLSPFPSRLRDRRFWIIQVLVLGITVFHSAGEFSGFAEGYGTFRHFPVVLYIGPIIYASLHFGFEGAVLTGLWCTFLSSPNMAFWHHSGWGAELSLLALVGSLSTVLAWRVEREAELRRQAEEVSAELLASKERLQFYLHQVTRAQEEERQRIARELHDDTAQALVLLCRGLDALTDQGGSLSPAAVSRLEELRRLADSTLESVRRFSRDLRPPVLDDLGLMPAIEWLLSDLSRRQGTLTQLEVEGTPRRLLPDAELALFRIVQEALRNVEKHAAASKVMVKVAFNEGHVRVSVSDDGKGFRGPLTLQDMAVRGKLGLLGMQERAQLLGGKLALHSQPGEGTSVTVEIRD